RAHRRLDRIKAKTRSSAPTARSNQGEDAVERTVGSIRSRRRRGRAHRRLDSIKAQARCTQHLALGTAEHELASALSS
ncbi:MAG: hypothetical protein WCI05_14605, partial [Myxococcales bacterium]